MIQLPSKNKKLNIYYIIYTLRNWLLFYDFKIYFVIYNIFLDWIRLKNQTETKVMKEHISFHWNLIKTCILIIF